MNPSQHIAPQSSSGGPQPLGRLSRGALFILFASACIIVTAIYVNGVIGRDATHRRRGAAPDGSSYAMGTRPWPASKPMLLFASLVAGDNLRNRIAVVPLESPDGPRWLTRLACQRVHFAGGRGICLSESGGTVALEDDVIAAHAYVFTPDLQIRHDLTLGGFPSRVRIAPDGRYGAVTVFVAGHSYADAGFSTETTLIDLERGIKIGNLETFTVSRDGRPFRSADFNFWGVTFAADSDRFYATLGTGGATFLVEGSVRSRRIETRRQNVECPSLSPDGKRLAFKKRETAQSWRFHVLDLATMTDTALAERRSVDDQIEWLDDERVLYGAGGSLWSVPADGSGTPAKLVSQASSPTMLHSALPTGDQLAAADLPAGNSLAVRGTDLAVTITARSELTTIGGQIGYTVSVANHGPGDATDVRVDSLLGDGLTLDGTPIATNPRNGYGCSRQNERGMTCDTSLLPNGATWTISMNARATGAGTPITRAVVSGAQSDPQAANDNSEVRTTVRASR
jgi:uncharacterized repeat protein (TIGR01451 family)